MEIFVEDRLINLRFFSNPVESVQKTKNKLNNIKERINLVLENINLLNVEYSSSDKEVDDKFIFITRFIAQNIHVLKRQLKSTYNELPWEEVEFCLTSFISSHVEQQELNGLCRAVLNKKKILSFLMNFAKKLEIMEIVDSFELAKLPGLVREEGVARIIKKNPQFAELYSDFCQVRDIYSLHIMSCYITRASSANPKNRTGQLCIIRALQVIGENLKNTWESPKLSDATSKLLLFSLSKNTATIIKDLRDSLSHAYSLNMRAGIEKNVKSKFFFDDIQNDINKVGVTIKEILHDKKLKIILALLEKIMKSKKSSEMKEFSVALRNISILPMIINEFMSKELNNIETCVMEYKSKIKSMTDFEKERFNDIRKIIDSKKRPMIRSKTDYIHESMDFFLFGVKKLQSCDKKEISLFIDQIEANILPKVGTDDFKRLANLVLQIHGSIISRSEDPQLNVILYKILYIAQVEVKEVEGIEEMNTTLGSGGSGKNDQDYGLKIGENYQGELDRKLSVLRSILKDHGLRDHDQIVEKFPSYKKDNELQSTLEMLVLDIMTIFGELRNSLPRNIFFLDDNAPLLIGRPLRDYIAHSDVLIDALLLSNPLIALILNAKELSEENFMKNMRNIGKLLHDDPVKLREKYTASLAAIANQERMFSALVDGNLDDLNDSQKLGADFNSKCFNLQTALHLAARGPNLDTFKFVYSHNLSLNAKDINGQTPLHVAAAYGRKDIVEFIVKERSVGVNDVDNDRNTPLHMAAQNGHKSAVECLLKNGADLRITNIERLTSLHCAVKNNHTKIRRQQTCVALWR
uniref:Ankyrin repeat domain protein n=2 Tax=Planococcus citri TaxID=170843 RepID=S5NZS9_9HEMI|nr:ankyrin repeat domain protein [Planococcus citri]